MQRRGVLALGLTSTALLISAGGALALIEPGLRAGKLGDGARAVMGAVAAAMLDGSLPASRPDRDAAIIALLERVESLVSALPPHVQRELSQLFALLANPVGRRSVAGLDKDWPQADLPQVQHALQSMRVASWSLPQQAYHALHDVVGSAYFADSSTWGLLGYPGPIKI